MRRGRGTLAALTLLCAACAPHRWQPDTTLVRDELEGTWSVAAGPVADGDSSRISLIHTPAGARGVWIRHGDHPVVPLDSVRTEGGGLVFRANMGAGAALMHMRPGPGGWQGEWSRGAEHHPFSARLVSHTPSRALVATFSLQPFAPGVLTRADSGESFPSLGPRDDEIVFTRHPPNWSRHRIMYARRVASGWSEPVQLPFSGQWNDREPKLSPDGQRLVFSSNRPLHAGGTPRRDLDLWMVERLADGGWGEPRHLDAVSSDAHDFCPVLAADGTLYFISTRSGTPPLNHMVWRARLVDGVYQPPELLPPTINTGYETNVFVSPDQRLMLLSRDGAPGGLGGDDLYLSEWRNGGWTPARLLPEPVSSYEYDYGPALSADGRWLYFTSHRRGNGDLYRIAASSAGIPQPRR